MQLNRQSYLFEVEADAVIPLLVPKYAKSAQVKKDTSGFWVNVSWKCGLTAPMTIQEEYQARDNQPNKDTQDESNPRPRSQPLADSL